jgi:uncharacterized glyoxalase superfamily protein PhnB
MSETQRPNIFPVMRYQDADAAIKWLGEAFGFEEKAVHRGEDGTVHHAEMQLGAGLIMLSQHRPDGWFGAGKPDPLTSAIGVYVVVPDPDAHHARARAAGAEIVRALSELDYGSREYSARDLEGNLWSFGTYDPYAGD